MLFNEVHRSKFISAAKHIFLLINIIQLRQTNNLTDAVKVLESSLFSMEIAPSLALIFHRAAVRNDVVYICIESMLNSGDGKHYTCNKN
jgi:hypothetical protein